MNACKKSYIYADGQILAQYDGDPAANPPPDIYFYLHDRLGSVRQVIDAAAAVVNHYTYEPYGQTIDAAETVPNPWRFTGQYWDAEIQEYHLRARQYNAFLATFTARDPAAATPLEPLTLHRYLYCINSPTKYVDPAGMFSLPEAVIGMAYQGEAGLITGLTFGIINEAFRSAIEGDEFNWDNVRRSMTYGMVAGGLFGAVYHGAVGIELVGTMPKNFLFSIGAKMFAGGVAATGKGILERNAARNVAFEAVIRGFDDE